MQISQEDFDSVQDDAIRAQDKLLYMRGITDAHKSYLRDSAATDQSNEEFQRLLANVFSPHELTNFAPIARRAVKFDSLEEVSRWFHHKYFQSVRLIKGGMEDSVELNQDSFREHLTRASWISRDNNIQFLVGNIGDGNPAFWNGAVVLIRADAMLMLHYEWSNLDFNYCWT